MTAVLLVLILLLAVVVIGLALYVKVLRTERQEMHEERRVAATTEVRLRQRAVATSRTVHVAKISEMVAPLLPDWPGYSVKDVQWVGGTIDMLIFDGLEAGGEVTVVLLDVKTGKATLTPRQRRIRDAVQAGRVRFEEYRPAPVPAVPEITAAPTDDARAAQRLATEAHQVGRVSGRQP